jgi:hypothetical protein
VAGVLKGCPPLGLSPRFAGGRATDILALFLPLNQHQVYAIRHETAHRGKGFARGLLILSRRNAEAKTRQAIHGVHAVRPAS